VRHLTRRTRSAISALLCIAVTATLSFPLAQPADSQESPATFGIVVIPDTQIYAQTDSGAEIFVDQFEWIVENQTNRDFVFVSHVGDVVQNPQIAAEWDRSEPAFAALDAADVPYGISPGNHDMDDGGIAPEYDTRFGTDRYLGEPWFGGNHAAEGNRSSYQTISVDGHDLLFVHVRHLQSTYGPTQPVLDWVDTVLGDHPDHLAFVTTHEFTFPLGFVLIPELQQVVQDNCNVVAVFSGHHRGVGRGEFDDSCGRSVHHLVTNYQHFPDGGQGFLRTVDIDPLTLQADFQVYSPWLDEFRTDPAENFTAALAPLVPIPGDVTCDRVLNVSDALVIAQHAVGVRTTHNSCPLPNATTDLNLSAADANNDGVINVSDALLVAQCVVATPNVLCPELVNEPVG